MTLYELGCQYDESAELIRRKIKVLRAEYMREKDEYKRFHIDRRIRTLSPMLTECHKMAKFLKCYYEPGFYIADGAYGIRLRGTEEISTEVDSGNCGNNSKGTVNERPIRNIQRILCGREDDSPNSKGARR